MVISLSGRQDYMNGVFSDAFAKLKEATLKKQAEKEAEKKILAEEIENEKRRELETQKLQAANLETQLQLEDKKTQTIQTAMKYIIPAAAGITLLMLLKK